MKTKLVPLTLLIPVVVLAQPASPAQAPQPPQASASQNPTLNPTDDAKTAIAIKALSNAKKKSSSGDPAKSMANNVDQKRYKYKLYSVTGDTIYYCENKDSYSTKTCTIDTSSIQ